jgi:hypothetical protein
MTAVAPVGWFGPIPLIGSAKRIAVAANIDGHLELFFIDTKNHLGHSFQTQVDGIFWAPLNQLSTRTISQIAAIQNIDGRLEVFYTDSKGNLWHNFQTRPQTIADQPTLKLPWFAEQTLANIKAKQFAVARNQDGRLELFFIDSKNNLNHIWELAVPNTNDPSTWNSWSGVASFARTAKALTAGVNDDGRLEMFYTGTDKTLYHDWQTTPATLPTTATLNAPNNPNPWIGQTLFDKGSKANQVSLGQNSDGRLEIFYVGTSNDLFHGYETTVIMAPHKESANDWSPQSRIAKLSAKQVTSVLDQSGFLYALYVGMKNKADYAQQLAKPSVAQPATLNSWNTGSSFPQNAKQIVAAGNADGRSEVFCVGTDDKLSHIWRTANIDRRGSNQNLILSGSSPANPGVCPNLINVLVAITITQDLVVGWTTGPTKGFGFQLNAYSAPNFKCIFQQYGFSLEGSSLQGWVNNYGAKGKLINSWYDMMKFKNYTIPAGTQFQISLGNDTATGNVTEFSCTVFDGSGTKLAGLDKKMKSVKGGSTKNLAPITAFELDIVGPDNSAGTVFTSGAGTIQYSADNQLFVSDAIPGCSGGQGRHTEEISNARYAAIPANQSFAFSQNFSIVGTANP